MCWWRSARTAIPAALGAVADNVHVERFVAQAQVLDLVDVVVHHGGYGTVLGVLAAGLPQLILPQGADQFHNATSLVDFGAARALRADEQLPGAIGAAVAALLAADASERVAVADLQAEIAALPAPARGGTAARAARHTIGSRSANHNVGISPPSMTKSAPVTLPARPLASSNTRSATSSGEVNRLVAAPATALSATAAASAPLAAAKVSATPPAPSQSGVLTGPGLIVLTRMPCGPKLFGQGLGEVGECRLGRGVVDDGRVRQECVHRTDRDDRPAAPLQQVRDGGPGGPHRSEQIDGQRAQPIVIGDRDEAAEVRLEPADVVHQNVQPAEFGHGLLDQLRRTVGAGQVDGNRVHIVAEPLQRGRGPGAGHHQHTLGRQRRGDGQADALGRAGDHSYLAGQVEFHDGASRKDLSTVGAHGNGEMRDPRKCGLRKLAPHVNRLHLGPMRPAVRTCAEVLGQVADRLSRRRRKTVRSWISGIETLCPIPG